MRQLIKFTLLTLLTASTGHTSFSQVVIGLKAGANLTNVKFEESPIVGEQNYRLGFNAGLLANIGINEKILIRPELIYSLKGWQYPAIQNSSAGTLNLNYINLPLLVGYKPVEKLTILLGPEVGLLISAISRSEGKTNRIPELYNRIDVGVGLGAAYNLNPKFGVDLRYTYGFKGLFKFTFTDENGSPVKSIKDGSNRALQLGVFYLLFNGK